MPHPDVVVDCEKLELDASLIRQAQAGASDGLVLSLLDAGANPAAVNEAGEDALYWALRNRMAVAAVDLIHRGATVHRATRGAPRLLTAVDSGCPEIVLHALLHSGASVNSTTSPLSRTALMVAAFHGDLTAVKLLLASGASLAAKDERGHDALTIALMQKHEPIVVYLIQHSADVDTPRVYYPGLRTATPLYTAVRKGLSTRTLGALVDAGADVNRRCITGSTPLHVAALKNCADAVVLLLSRGADAGLTDRSGFDALYFALNGKKEEAAMAILQHAEVPLDRVYTIQFNIDRLSTTALHTAVMNKCSLDVVRVLVERGASVTATIKPTEFTAPMLAVELGQVEVTEYFLTSCSVDLSTKNSKGEDALSIALGHGYNEISLLLLRHGARVRKSGRPGGPIDHLNAAFIGECSEEVFRALLDAGCDINAPMSAGSCPLMVAARAGNVKMAEMAVRLGCQMMAPDGDPLFGAAMLQRPEMLLFLARNGSKLTGIYRNSTPPLVECGIVYLALTMMADAPKQLISDLLDAGAPADTDGANVGMLHWVINNGRLDLVRLFLARGARMDVFNADGRDPLTAAIRSKNTAAALLLVSGSPALSAAPAPNPSPSPSPKAGAALISSLPYLNTAITVCAEHRVIEALVKKGLDLGAKDRNGETAMHAAILMENIRAIDLFVEHGAPVEPPGDGEQSPLAFALEAGCDNAGVHLVRLGASATRFCFFGDLGAHVSPLEMAAVQHMPRTIVALLAAGAHIHLPAPPKLTGGVDSRGIRCVGILALFKAFSRGDIDAYTPPPPGYRGTDSVVDAAKGETVATLLLRRYGKKSLAELHKEAQRQEEEEDKKKKGKGAEKA
jgi:ankyrin repeat protein